MSELNVKGGKVRSIGAGEVDLNYLVKRLKSPYKLGISLSLFLILCSMVLLVIFHRSGFSFMLIPIQLILLVIVYFLKKRLKEVEDKIYLWGVEDTWKYYKGK